MENNWKFFKEVDFSDESIVKYNVDTRDFHVGLQRQDDMEEDFDTSTLEKYPGRFFHTSEEVVDLLERYFIESGGRASWRYFSLLGMENWSMKYIRIRRTQHGLVICNGDNRALSREILSRSVDTENLAAH